MCWYCYWGWPKPVADVYDKHLAAVDGVEDVLHYGPAHIVWADENFQDDNIDYCIEQCDKPEKYAGRLSPEEIWVVRQSLLALKAIPIEIRCPPGCENDNDDAPKYPPPVGMEMVKR